MAAEELAASAAPSAMPTATPTLIFADLVDPSLAEVLIVVLIVLGALALLTGARASHAVARALGGAAVSEGGTVRVLCGAAIACCIRILAKNQALPRAGCCTPCSTCVPCVLPIRAVTDCRHSGWFPDVLVWAEGTRLSLAQGIPQSRAGGEQQGARLPAADACGHW
jgi:hypothetical protein